MRTMLVGLAAGMLLTMAAVADEVKGDPAKLQGAWKAQKAEQNGKEQPNPEEHTLTFEKDTFTITRKDQVILKGTFTVNAIKKPWQINLAIKESRGGRDNGKTRPGASTNWTGTRCAGVPRSRARTSGRMSSRPPGAASGSWTRSGGRRSDWDGSDEGGRKG
jgi:uncharacterized protein (TIGR03067 family)